MRTRSKRATRRPFKTRVKRTTRVTVDFPKNQHRLLKANAALEGISLQEYIRNRVMPEDGNIPDHELKPIVKKIISKNRNALKRLASK